MPSPRELRRYWEDMLTSMGMPSVLPEEEGTRVQLGNGLGQKTYREEDLEDEGSHSRMCPLRLGIDLNGKVDQPNERPVEDQISVD